MYRKTTNTKSIRAVCGIQSTALSLICASAAVFLLAFAVCGITSSAQTEEVTDTVTDTRAYGFLGDVPDPPLTGETEIVYEETHYPIKRVDIASVSTPKGKPETEAEPSADAVTEEAPITESATDSDTATQTVAQTQTAPVTEEQSEREPPVSLSSPAVIALGSVLAVMAAITAAALAIRRKKQRSGKTDDESSESGETVSPSESDDTENDI